MKNRLTRIARSLRKRMTDAERRLWKALRGKQLEGLKFRRQQPIGAYIVDFVCFEKRIVVEADGSRHYEGEQMQKDFERDRRLREQGFQVLRFTNREIMSNTEGVILSILEHASARSSAHQAPSPFKGEG